MSEPGRRVVVTGASRGLGRATAAQLHRAGWTVLAAMRNPDRDLEALRTDAGAAVDDPRLIPIGLGRDRGRRSAPTSSRRPHRGIVLVSSQGASTSTTTPRWPVGRVALPAGRPFGMGVSIIVTGTFKTDMLELTTT